MGADDRQLEDLLTLRREVVTAQTLAAARAHRARAPESGRLAVLGAERLRGLSRELGLAHALRRRLERGELADLADMARQLGVTRARVTQLMDLLFLAPVVQDEILTLELLPMAQPVSERGLREAVLGTIDWQEQRRRWEGLRAQYAPAMMNER